MIELLDPERCIYCDHLLIEHLVRVDGMSIGKRQFLPCQGRISTLKPENKCGCTKVKDVMTRNDKQWEVIYQ